MLNLEEMADVATHFPPQTYSSSFFLNALTEEDSDRGRSKKIRIRDKTTPDSPTLLDCFITKTMSPAVPVGVVLLLVWSVAPKAEAIECIDVNSPRTRVFDTLLDLQANKVSFDPHNRDFQGNYVSIKDPIGSNVETNSFIAYDSKFIIKMSLNDHRIEMIQDGAFKNLDCLRVLDLNTNRIDSLSRPMFQGLRDLHELDLSRNAIEEVPERVFTLVPRLKRLNLSMNGLKVLHPESFFNLFILEELDLSHNSLRAVPPETFHFPDRLVRLDLSFNRIERSPFEKWNTSRLGRLDLSENLLESFDTSYRFSFSSSLAELYLNGNLLTRLNEFGLQKNLPNLKRIDVNDNPWLCPHLVPLVKALNDSRVVYVRSAVGEPQVNGIACNRSMDMYVEKKKRAEEPTEAPAVVPATTVYPSWLASVNATQQQTVEILQKISYFVTFTFVVVCLYILADLVVRTHLLNSTCDSLQRVFNRNRSMQVFDNSNVGLLQDRLL